MVELYRREIGVKMFLVTRTSQLLTKILCMYMCLYISVSLCICIYVCICMCMYTYSYIFYMSQRAVQGHVVPQFGISKPQHSSVAAGLVNNTLQCTKSQHMSSFRESICLESSHASFYIHSTKKKYTIYLKTL